MAAYINSNGGFYTSDGVINPADRLATAQEIATQALTSAKAAKIAFLSAACKSEITGGFVSSALGSAHKYDGELEWQLNLAGAKDYTIANNVSAEFTCTNQATGVKAGVVHTPAQITQAFNDGVVFKMARLSKYRTLKTQVEAMTTIADVETVNWR